MKTKICNKCYKRKPFSSFNNRPKAKDGVAFSCKKCEAIYQKEYSLKHKKQISKCNHRLYLKNKIAIRKRNLSYYLSHRKETKKRLKNYWLKKNYGISLIDYKKLLKKQNGVCAICSKKESNINQFGRIKLAVDHDHKTKKLRGLLCVKCNMALGLFQDNTDNLKQAIQYLEK